ncbi:MAG TPA: LysM domain-containing protein [Thermoanaerobaculia bacterium]|nr:LysM domain-containing protein [Thermoanaerobaculia bacterium]
MSDVFALQQALPLTPFSPSSRYSGIEIAKITIDGETYAYVRRRFVPLPERLSIIGEHIVVSRERLDHIAALYLGDPELFWRVCDANRAMRPEALTETVGRTLAIALPEGIPGLGS